MRIWKYKLYVQDASQTIYVPGAYEAKVVAMHLDTADSINVWVEVDPDAVVGKLEFRVFPTGAPVELTRHRQTVHHTTLFDDRTGLVWHVYQLHEVLKGDNDE